MMSDHVRMKTRNVVLTNEHLQVGETTLSLKDIPEINVVEECPELLKWGTQNLVWGVIGSIVGYAMTYWWKLDIDLLWLISRLLFYGGPVLAFIGLAALLFTLSVGGAHYVAETTFGPVLLGRAFIPARRRELDALCSGVQQVKRELSQCVNEIPPPIPKHSRNGLP